MADTSLVQSHLYSHGHLFITATLFWPEQNAPLVIFLFNEPLYHGHCPDKWIWIDFFWSVGDWINRVPLQLKKVGNSINVLKQCRKRHICKMAKNSFKETLKAHTPHQNPRLPIQKQVLYHIAIKLLGADQLQVLLYLNFQSWEMTKTSYKCSNECFNYFNVVLLLINALAWC